MKITKNKIPKLLHIAWLQQSLIETRQLYELTNHSKRKAKHLKRIKLLKRAVHHAMESYLEMEIPK